MSLTQEKLKSVFTRRVDCGVPPPHPPEGRPPVDNVVKTSRYTFWDFIPRNLISQFLEPANTYFLIVGILQIIPQTSTSGGIPNQYVPLAFILFVSATRAAIEDYHKHVSDNAESAKQYLVFDRTKKDFVRKASGSIIVGDIVRVTKADYSDPKHPLTDSFPADLVFLSGANPKGNSFVETASLDGETNLKNRQACHVTHTLIHHQSYEEEMDRLSKLKFTVRCEAPNADLRKFRGFLWVQEAKEVPNSAGLYNRDEGIELKTDCLMLRNTNLRNTAYMYGLVVYTGTETKIRQNISAESKMRIKRSSVMRKVDRMLAGMFAFQVALCLLGGIYAGVWQDYHKDDWYLKLEGENSALEGFIRFFTWFIILSQMVPISLLVSTELVKFGQAVFIAWDNLMYYAPNDKEAVVLSSQLNEDLGQVEYVFTDKTGTLTQNKMEFRVGYVGIEMFGDPRSEIARRVEERIRDCELRQKGQKTAPRKLWNESLSALKKKQEETAALGLTEDFIGPNEMNRMAETLWGKKGGSGGAALDAEKSERIRLYLLHCALSNTITPEPKVEADGKTSLVLQFTSPDELAICRFAQAMGYDLTQRTKEAVKLRVRRRGFGDGNAPAEQEHVFKQLALLDFNPKRKRVTVIYQEGNRVLVMCKGQDSRVVPLIHSETEDEKKAIGYLQEQLVIMGNKALRTMVMGHAELPFEWWSGKIGSDGRVTGGMEQKWNFLRSLPDSGDETKHDRGECAPACRICGTLEEIERAAQMKLIGATCLEDRLQDLVPESIEDFLLAGVKVWMLTGDKLPTAKNIGMACNLIDPDMEKPEPQHRADKKDLSRLLSVTGRWAALAKDEKELNFLFGRLSEADAKNGVPVIARDDLQAFLFRMAMPGMEDSDTKPEFFNNLWSQVDVNNNGKIDEGEFLRFMRSTKLTFWKAVQADLKGALRRVEAIGEDSLYQLPVSLVIDGAAFNVLYPEKPPAKKAVAPKAEGKVAPAGVASGSAPSGTTAVVVAPKRDESKSQLGGLVEKVEAPSPEELESMRTDFFKVTSLCKSVVCCELTPAQKGAIVKQVQLRNGAVTLAIGDGGNDCVMIKTANIGVGIAGVEGVDAARAGEYAIGQFYHLHSLLFVHGAWSYRRIAKLVLYIFYKASLVALTMFFFGFFSGFSGQQYLNDVSYQFYNVMFTALPVMAVAIFDQTLSRRTMEDNPEAYGVIAKGALFNTAIFSAWIMRALLTALLVFFMVFGSLGQINVFGESAHTYGLWELSTLSYITVVCIASLLIILDMATVTWIHHLVVWGSIAAVFLVMFLLNISTSFNFALYWVVNTLYGSAAAWLTLILTVMIPILLDVAIVGIYRLMRPSLIDILKERQALTPAQLDKMMRDIASGEVVAEGQPLVTSSHHPQATVAWEQTTGPAKVAAPLQKVRAADVMSSPGGTQLRDPHRITDAVLEAQIRYNDTSGADFTATPQSGNFEVSKADLAWALAVERDMKEKGTVHMRSTPSMTMSAHGGNKVHPQLPADMGDHLHYHDRDHAPAGIIAEAKQAANGDEITSPASVRIVAQPTS